MVAVNPEDLDKAMRGELRFRYGDFLYYREVDGTPKISKVCVGADNPTKCDDFDLFVNLHTPSLQRLLLETFSLCQHLAALGIAPQQVATINAALADLNHATPCSKRMTDEQRATAASAILPKKHMH